MSATLDLLYTYRFLKILTTPWNKQDAFKEGIIDDKGTLLKKHKDLETNKEKQAYNYFHRMVFNMKRLINSLPGGESQIKSYGAALLLLKEDDDSLTLFDAGHLLVESYYDTLPEEVANSVSSGNVDFTPHSYKSFTVPTEVFRRFDTGRNKFERWAKYLDLSNENQQNLYQYALKKPKNTIILQDETTGAMRSIRRRSSNGS